MTPGKIVRKRAAKMKNYNLFSVESKYEQKAGFFSAIMSIASEFYPVIGGWAEEAIGKSGNGHDHGKWGHKVSEIHLLEGDGLYLSPLFHPKEGYYDELWI